MQKSQFRGNFSLLSILKLTISNLMPYCVIQLW